MGLFTFIGIMFTSFAEFFVELCGMATTTARAGNKAAAIVEAGVDAYGIELQEDNNTHLEIIKARNAAKIKEAKAAS